MKECTFRLENFFKKQSSIKVQSMGWKFLYYRQEHWQKIQVKSNFFCTPRKIDEVCQTMKINPTQKPFELVRTNFFLKMLIQKECAQSFLMSVIRLLIYNSGTSNFWWIPAAPPPPHKVLAYLCESPWEEIVQILLDSYNLQIL